MFKAPKIKILTLTLLCAAVFYALAARPARSAGSKLSLACAGQPSDGLWQYVCQRVAGEPQAIVKQDAHGGVVSLGAAATAGDVEVLGARANTPRSVVRLGATGGPEVVDASGRTVFKDFLPTDALRLSPEMPSVVVAGDLPMNAGGTVTIDLRSPTAEMTGGRAVFVGNAPNIAINVSGRDGQDGRPAGVAVALQAASGQFGSGASATNLISKMSLTASPSEPQLGWNDLSASATRCEDLGQGFKTPNPSSDGGRSVSIAVDKAREVVATRNICERLTSQEVSVQSTCVRPGEIAGVVSCDYPDISQKVGSFRRPNEEKTVSFSCASGDLAGIWQTSCAAKQSAVVTAAIRPDYVVTSPSKDIVAGMRVPLTHNFPIVQITTTPCKTANYFRLFESSTGGANLLDVPGFDPTSERAVSDGPANRYMGGSEFSLYKTPTAQAYPGQPSDFSSLIKNRNGAFLLDDCGQSVTKLTKLSMLGAIVDEVKSTVIPGSLADQNSNIKSITNLGYWATRGTKGLSSAARRNITDALSGVKIPAKASAHDQEFKNNKPTTNPDWPESIAGRLEGELRDLGFLPFDKKSAMVSYDKLTAKRERTQDSDNSFLEAVTPMIEASQELTVVSGSPQPTRQMKVDAFLTRILDGARTSSDAILATQFREKITYTFENLRVGLATKRGTIGPTDQTVYRALTAEPIALAPRAIYIPGAFSVSPITTIKYCDSIDIDDSEIFFRNGDAVKLGGVEITNGARLNMRSPTSHSSVFESDRASDHEKWETPQNILSGWGMSFLKINDISLRQKNSACAGASNSITVEHRLSTGQKKILNKIKNSSGLLIVAKGSTSQSTISVYFSPAMSPKPVVSGPQKRLWMNTGISDGVYLPRVNVSPARITSDIDPSSDQGNAAFHILNSDTQIPAVPHQWLPYKMIKASPDYAMRAQFSLGLEYFDLPTNFQAETTRALGVDAVNPSTAATVGQLGTAVRAAKYIKSLRKMSLAVDPQNPQNSTTTVARENSGGTLTDRDRQPVAILTDHIGLYDGEGSPSQSCTSESMIETLRYPTKLVSRRAVGGGGTGQDLDMNVTSNEEVSDLAGPINSHNRRIGYFSRAFLPTAYTIGYDNYEKNRADPYYLARDYNTFLADIQKNSSLTVTSSGASDGTPPASRLTTTAVLTTPRPTLPTERVRVYKPYDLMLDFGLAKARFQDLAGLSPSAPPTEVNSGQIKITDPGVWSCLNQKRSSLCLGSTTPLGRFLVPFTLMTGDIRHVEPTQECTGLQSAGTFECHTVAAEDRLEVASSRLMSQESGLYRPHNMFESLGYDVNWWRFYRCRESGSDVTERSRCGDQLGGLGTVSREGYKRFPITAVESPDMLLARNMELNQGAWLNETYFSGLLAPMVGTGFDLFGRRKQPNDLLVRSSVAESGGLRPLPTTASSLVDLAYDTQRLESLAAPLGATDGGASYFEGAFGLPLLGNASELKLWMEWYETGGVEVSKSKGELAYYNASSGGVDGLSGVLFGGGTLATQAAGAYQLLAADGESPPAAYGRVAAGILPYGATQDLATATRCVNEGTSECFAAARFQTSPGATGPSGSAAHVPLSRRGMSGYMFAGCADNLAPSSLIKPRGDIESETGRHGFTVTGGSYNFSEAGSYTLYLPFAVRDWNGAYFGPVVGENFEPLYKDGFTRNALVLPDLLSQHRAAAGVDVYETGSQQKTMSELSGPSVTIYSKDDDLFGLPRGITLDAAVDEARRVVLHPAIPGTKSYEDPLALSPDVLLAVLSHDDFGDELQDGQVLGDGPGQETARALYLKDAVRALSSDDVNEKIAAGGLTIDRLAADDDGVARAMVLSPRTLTAAPTLVFGWVVSSDSLLATVVSPGVRNGAQAADQTISGGVVNGVAGGVAINYGRVVGDDDDSRAFTSAIPGNQGDGQIRRSQGVIASLMGGAGFTISSTASVSGITARLQTNLDGSSRVAIGSAVSGASAYFLADEICGLRKQSSDPTATSAIQNHSQEFGYCATVDDQGFPTTNQALTPAECAGLGEWRYKKIRVAEGSYPDRVNPYAAVCTYAATRGQQTAAGIPSRWDEVSSDTPQLVDGACAASSSTGLGMTVCAVDRQNSMNNIYWETQTVDIAYGVDPYGAPTGNVLVESEDPRAPTVCPAGTTLRTQRFIAAANPPLQTFTAANNFAGADFDQNLKPQCPYSCSVAGLGIDTEAACVDKTVRPPSSQNLPNGTWSRMTKVASVNVSLFADPSLCYSDASGASVRDLRTEAQKIAGSMTCGGTYGRCDKPGRLNQVMCQSESLPGGAGVWTDGAATDSSFKPTVMYGPASAFRSTQENVSSSILPPPTGSPSFEPYTILHEVVEVHRRRAAEIGAPTVVRAGVGGEPDILGQVWMREAVYERPLCQNFFFSKTDGLAVSGALALSNTTDLGILLPRSSAVEERRRYGAIDPFMVQTKARQVTIEGGLGTNLSAYADACDFNTVDATTAAPIPRPGFGAADVPQGLNTVDFSRRVAIDYLRGEAVSVTRIQPTPWSTEAADGGFSAPSCDIFNDTTIAAREGSVSVRAADLATDRSFLIGEERGGVNRRTLFKANPDTFLDASSRNVVPAFAYGGTWHKTGEERLELTRANSATPVDCRIYTDSSLGADSCAAPIPLSSETVDGQAFNIIAENGENGGAAGSAVVLSTLKPVTVSILAAGGAGGQAGGTTIDGQPTGNMMCYQASADPLNPFLRIYKFRQNAAVVKPASSGTAGPGGAGRGVGWWGIAPEARLWLQKSLAP